MNPFDFNTPTDRQGTSSLKWNKYEGRDIIPLWVADMDFRSPPSVIEALHQRIDHGIFGYTHPPEELTETILRMLDMKYRWKVEHDWLIYLPGLVTGINVACRAVGEDGDSVMTNVPVYPPFLSAPELSRRSLITFPLVQVRGRWTFDLEKLKRAITPNTKLFLFCTPHNPAGRIFTHEELTELSDICERHDIILCSDEIHCDLLLDEDKKHIPTATLSHEVAKRSITLMAPSKTYNIPGLGCSFAIIPDDRLRQRFQKAMARIVPHVNTLGYTAALAAYRDGQKWLDSLLNYLKKNRDIVTQAINVIPGLTMTHVEATYLAWIDTRQANLDDPMQFFEDIGVGLSDGQDFGGKGFMRLNFGCSRSLLEEALNRMKRAME